MRRLVAILAFLLAAQYVGAGTTALGDFHAGDTVYCGFATSDSSGTPTNPAGSPAAKVYKDADTTTETTTGVTCTFGPFDSMAGNNVCTIDTSQDGTFYAAGHFFRVTLTAGTVSGTSVIGYVPCSFTLDKANVSRIYGVSASSVTTINANVGTTQPINFTGTGASALAKSDLVDIAGTASAGAAGYVGLDWSAINAPTSSQTLSNTTVGVVTSAALSSPDSAVIVSTTGSNQTSSVIRLASGSTSDGAYVGSILYVTGGTKAGSTRVIRTYTGATKDATLDEDLSISNGTGVAVIRGRFPAQFAGYVTLPVTPPTAAEIASATWDEDLSGHTTAGTAGKTLSDIPTLAAPTAAQVAAAIFNEPRAGYTTAGTFGRLFNALGIK